MSTRVEQYAIYGVKFGSSFTEEYWKKDFRDEMEWDKNKPPPYWLFPFTNPSFRIFSYSYHILAILLANILIVSSPLP